MTDFMGTENATICNTDTSTITTLQLDTMSFPVDIANFGRIMKEIRRVSDPDKGQIIWDGIKTVRAQKQIPALPRLSRYMYRNYKLDKETTQRLLDLAVEDNLIKLQKKVGTKGNKAGVEEDAYRLPTEDMLPFERHDWYCFHCHSGGEVVLCRDCHRVYHQGCLKEELIEEMGFVCNYCRLSQISQNIPEATDAQEKKDLNYLLFIVTKRCKEMLPGSILSRAPPPPAKNPYLTSDRKATVGEGGIVNSADREAFASFGEEKWRAKFLLKRQIDLDDIYSRCENVQYRSIDEFRADVQNIVHNVVIYHGGHSHMSDMAKQMFRACSIDLNEIQTCRDCFRYAHNRGDRYWFAKPCRPAHSIVYAKQEGYPYWPAKVLSNNEAAKVVDVRFFGGYHQRAKVDTVNIKPISTNVHTLSIKKTSAWNKASDELSRYQELYEKCCNTPNFFNNFYGDPFEGEKAVLLLASSKFGVEDDSEDDVVDTNQPGDPGTSLPQQEYQLVPQMRHLTAPLINPHSVLPPRSQLVASNRSNPPAKLRRIEPKPVDILAQTVAHAQSSQVTLQQAQSQGGGQTLMLPLTVVTVPPATPQGSSPAQQLQPHSIHIQGTTAHINAQSLGGSTHVPAPMSTPQGVAQYPSLQPPPPPTPISQQQQQHHHHQQQQQSIQLQTLSSPAGGGTPQHSIAVTPVSTSSFLHFDTTSLSHEDLLSLHSTPVSINQIQPATPVPQHQMQQLNQSFQQQPPHLATPQPPQVQQPQVQQQPQQTFIQHMPTIPQDTLSHLLSPPPPPQPTHILPHAVKTSGVGSSKQPVPIGETSNIGGNAKQQQSQQQLPLLPPPSTLTSQPPTTECATFKPGEVKVKEEITEEGEGDDAVSSSSNLTRFVSVSCQTPNKLLRMVAEEISVQSRGKPSDKDFKEKAEILRTEFEQEKKRAVNVATRSLERDLERLKADHATEIEALTEKFKAELADSRRKQWCSTCFAEAIYWCCWNTAYCSTDCQQSHWNREHKKVCRRKR